MALLAADRAHMGTDDLSPAIELLEQDPAAFAARHFLPPSGGRNHELPSTRHAGRSPSRRDDDASTGQETRNGHWGLLLGARRRPRVRVGR